MQPLFPPLPEFDLVSSLLAQAGNPPRPLPPLQRGWLGPGDDCAQFDGWLATLDMSVEGTHFRMDWSTPEEAVEKCLLSNFSDVNAMGGVSKIVFLGLCLNKHWPALLRERVAAAFATGCKRRGVALMGGDTVTGEVASFAVTVLGTCSGSPLLRSAARAGQDIYLSGLLGRSAGGLWLLSQGDLETADWAKELLSVHRVPEVPLDLGPQIAKIPGVGACMDLSDGLSSELHHIALQSGVSLCIDENLLPVAPAVRALCQARGLDARPFYLHGGEEYNLLLTCDPVESVILSPLLQGGVLHKIGSVFPGDGVEIRTADGRLESLQAGAWSHL